MLFILGTEPQNVARLETLHNAQNTMLTKFYTSCFFFLKPLSQVNHKIVFLIFILSAQKN